MYHIFIHSSVDGHLGYFHILAIVNSTAMISGFTCLLELWLSQGICPVVGLLDHMATQLLVSLRTSILCSIVAAPIYIPTNSIRGFPFLSSLSSICRLFKEGHSDWREVVCCSSPSGHQRQVIYR